MDAGTDAGRFPVADPKKLSPMDATMQFLDPKKLVEIRVLHQNNTNLKNHNFFAY